VSWFDAKRVPTEVPMFATFALIGSLLFQHFG